MAWSIFDQPNGNELAVAWAAELLQAIGAQATPSTLQMVYSWERSEGGGGAYNPLNQGPVPGNPSLTTTGEQYGGGAADFAGWQAGIAGAVAYLDMPSYAGVKQALLAGNGQGAAQALWASPWAESHYGYGSAWSTTPYPPASPGDLASIAAAAGFNTNIASTASQIGTQAFAQGGAQVTGGVSNGTPQVPGMNDIPGLIAYIQQNDPSFAWLLQIPSVATVIEQGVSSQESTAQIQAAVQQTAWWKTTSTAYRNFLQQQAQSPSDYSFTTQGSVANQKMTDVMNQAAQLGVTLTTTEAQNVAMQALQYGWDTSQTQQAIGSYVTYAGGGATNAGSVVQQLQAQAGQYLMSPNDPTLQSWAQNIAAGTQTIQQFDAYLKQDASTKWTGMAPQIAQGYTPQQITNTLRNQAAQVMEIDPSQVDFVNNPFYSQILDYAPPNDNGQHRLMTQSEMDQYLKGSSQWGYTQQARDSAATLEQQISQTFGKVGQ